LLLMGGLGSVALCLPRNPLDEFIGAILWPAISSKMRNFLSAFL